MNRTVENSQLPPSPTVRSWLDGLDVESAAWASDERRFGFETSGGRSFPARRSGKDRALNRVTNQQRHESTRNL
jgi:hypothetical protein